LAEANRTPTCAFARQTNPFSDMVDNRCIEYLHILIIPKPFPEAIKKTVQKTVQKSCIKIFYKREI
jgi:hypothetical protein